MIADAVFRRFTDQAPLPVMIRALLERSFHPERLDAWFERVAAAQYTRERLFSTVFELMSQVVCGLRHSIHDAYQSCEDIAVSVVSVYRKLANLELGTAAAWVRYSACEAAAVMAALGYTRPSLVPGYTVKILDGNALPASERRLEALRGLSAGPLPGKAVVVYAPARNRMGDVFPGEDGHAQERALLPAIVQTVAPGEVWVGDRNVCVTAFLFGIDQRGACFIVREHGALRFGVDGAQQGERRIETGVVSEQPITLTHAQGQTLGLRRVRVRLDKPTRDGDPVIYLLTNLPPEVASAARVTEVYRRRWRLETAFQVLAVAPNCEIDTLAYPKAALFGFCVALMTYNLMAATQAALAQAHGAETIEQTFSDYSLAAELEAVVPGMLVALPESYWRPFRTLSEEAFAAWRLELAGRVRLARFQKHPRGPKKPPTPRVHDPNKPHVSAAKVIAAHKKSKSR